MSAPKLSTLIVTIDPFTGPRFTPGKQSRSKDQRAYILLCIIQNQIGIPSVVCGKFTKVQKICSRTALTVTRLTVTRTRVPTCSPLGFGTNGPSAPLQHLRRPPSPMPSRPARSEVARRPISRSSRAHDCPVSAAPAGGVSPSLSKLYSAGPRFTCRSRVDCIPRSKDLLW